MVNTEDQISNISWQVAVCRKIELHFTLLPINEFLRTPQGEVSVAEVRVIYFVEIT